MSKRMKIADLWDYLPPEARYVAMEKDGLWYWYSDKPKTRNSTWGDIEGPFARIGLALDYSGDWKDSLHERPQEIKPGMFGKFWDGEAEPRDDMSAWGVYLSMTGDKRYPYRNGYSIWRHFRPCLPAAQVEI